MATSQPVTRLIGEAERSLQALLNRQLQTAGLSFAQWVVLNILTDGGPLVVAELIGAIANAKICLSGSERDLVDELVDRHLIEGEAALTVSAPGRDVLQPLRTTVRDITARLISDVPEEEIAATRRTLETMTHRANLLLGRDAA